MKKNNNVGIFFNEQKFSVSKEIIRRRSLDYYRQLIKELENDKNPYQGYYLEWLWPYILLGG